MHLGLGFRNVDETPAQGTTAPRLRSWHLAPTGPLPGGAQPQATSPLSDSGPRSATIT